MLNSKKRFFIFTLLAYFFVSTTQTFAVPEQTRQLLKTLQTAAALAKLPCAITANAFELKDNENLALTLDALYRGLDISDTALKMAIDFDSVSYLEMSTEVYQLYKLGSDIVTLIKNHTKNQNQNPADKNKQNIFTAKKVIYSILKYLALAADSGSSLMFASQSIHDKIAASNLSAFFKIYANLIDNKKPEMRSIALTTLTPIALAISWAIAETLLLKKQQQKDWENRQKKWAEERKKREEEEQKEKEAREKLREKREKQEREEAERKRKEREEQEKKWWDSLSDEEKKQEQARRKKQQHYNNQAQFERNFKNKQKEERDNFWRCTKIDWDSRKRAYSHGRPFKFSGIYVDPFAGMSFTPPEDFLNNPNLKLGSDYIPFWQNKNYWDNVKKEWNDLRKKQFQEERQFQEEQKARERDFQSEKTQHKREEEQKQDSDSDDYDDAKDDNDDNWEDFANTQRNNPFFQNRSRFHFNIPTPPPAPKQPNYYEILGVDRNATDQQICKAYRILIKNFHSDKNEDLDPKEAEEVTKTLNGIKTILRDPKQKGDYDNNRVKGKPLEITPRTTELIEKAKTKKN